MFFPERILSINEDDRVLEIGPGSKPHPRSDILLELNYKDNEERIAQFGCNQSLTTDKQILFYDGNKFPFKNKEFDYIICSHVLEHVDNVELFISELQRVGKKGYLEFPTVYYDYIFNFEVHLNFLLWDGSAIKWMRKSENQPS